MFKYLDKNVNFMSSLDLEEAIDTAKSLASKIRRSRPNRYFANSYVSLTYEQKTGRFFTHLRKFPRAINGHDKAYAIIATELNTLWVQSQEEYLSLA
jgi:hypothetical protein